MTAVSIVMATYNGARFISEQLESLAVQTALPFELIVSDDGSVDATLDIVREFASKAPFPVIVGRNEQRLGYGDNFLNAAKLATGQYIAFCDQDDIWHPDKLATASASLDQTNADLFVHTAHLVDQEGVRAGQLLQGITETAVCQPLQLGPWSVFLGCTMVFPTRLLKLIDASERGGHTFEYEGLLSHDLWIHFLATGLGTIVTESRPLIDYRQHGGNVTPPVLTGGFRAWVRALGLPANVNLRRDDIARHRSELMRDLSSSTTDNALRQAAMRAAAYWTRISGHETLRIEMYSAGNALRRVTICRGLILSGAYRSYSHGGLGGRLFLKDLLAGVLPVRRLKR